MMTDKAILDTLRGERERLLAELIKTDPLSERYGAGLHNYHELRWIEIRTQYPEYGATTAVQPAPEQRTADAAEVITAAPAAEPAEKIASPITDTDLPWAESPVSEAPKYTKAQVRKLLGEAQTAHPKLNLPALLRSLGAKVLSDVPAEKYPELLAKVEDAVKELGE